MSPDDQAPGQEAVRRNVERTEAVEEIISEFEASLDDPKYPVTTGELSEWYATQVSDLPNETETLGDVIDRLADDTYSTSAELKEEVINALTGAEAGPEEYNDERDLLRIARDVSAAESRD